MTFKMRVAAFVAAVALVLAMPITALAANNSPVLEAQVTDDRNGVTTVLHIKLVDPTEFTNGGIRVDLSDQTASNTIVLNLEQITGRFEVTTFGNLSPEDVQEILATINVSSQYANHDIKVFLEYYDGTTDMITGVTSSTGTFQLTLAKVGYITVVLGDYRGGGGGGNDSPISPETGYDFSMAVVALGTIACLVGAVAIAHSLRKDNE